MIDFLSLSIVMLASNYLAYMDFKERRLPYRVNWLLFILGIVLSPVDLSEKILGAAFGFILLTLLNVFYKSRRGYAGLGGGDSILVAGCGVWLGIWMMPYLVLASSLLTLLYAGILSLSGQKITKMTKLPFGAFMALSLVFFMAFNYY